MEVTRTAFEFAPLPAGLLDRIVDRQRHPEPTPDSKRPSATDGLTAYARAALDSEIAELAGASAGMRNDALNKSAFALGQLVAVSLLTETEVEQALVLASEGNGLIQDDGIESVRATIRSGLDAGSKQPRELPAAADVAKRAPDLPRIVISAQMQDVVDRSLDALDRGAQGEIYVKGGLLVRVTRESKKIRGYKRVPDAPLISPLPEGRLQELMSMTAHWLRVKQDELEPALPPKWAVNVLQARGTWPFPLIECVSETPVLRPDGTVLQKPGYDEASGTLYLPNAAFLPIPTEPTRDDAARAVRELFDPFTDFPFKTLADGAVMLAGILTAIGRPAIAGPTPLFVVRKNVPGAGGSLAVDAISMIATGRIAPRMTLTSDSRELRKLILTLAIEGTQLVLFDNLEGCVGSATLAAAITSETWTDRLLGVNKTVRAPLRPTWFATGNGLNFNKDLGRRVLLCDMVSELEHPEDRTDFKYLDLIAHLVRMRPALVVAALTILRAYCVAGRPTHGKPRKGSFVEWDDLIRGALVWARAEDPMATTARLRSEADTDLDALRCALHAWQAAFPAPTTAARAVSHAKERDPELLLALLDMCECSADKFDGRQLGYSLRRYRDRVVGGLRFEKTESDGMNTGLWTVGRL